MWMLFLPITLLSLTTTGLSTPSSASKVSPPEQKAAQDEWNEDWDTESSMDVAVEDYVQEDSWYEGAFPAFERHFNVLSARSVPPWSLVFALYHRTHSPLRQDPFYDWLGFDAGSLKVGTAFRFGLIEGLDVGVMRLNGTVEAFDTYEVDLKYRFLHVPRWQLDLALRVGGSWFAHARHADAFKPFAQLLGTAVLAKRYLLSVGLLGHGDSTNPNKNQSDTDWTLAVAVALDIRLFENIAFGAEVCYAVAGYRATKPILTLGPKLITNRHTFSLVVTNSQYVSADSLLSNTDRSFEDLILGFNITREL
jgi:hypothetical protein